MADTSTYPILSVCATVGSKLSDLAIKNGQMLFIQDKHRIAMDYNGKRVFYNQIDELDTEAARKSLLAPLSGHYYFVIETAVLWTYRDNGWVQITTPPEDIVFIGATLPELGSHKTLYVDTTNSELSIWDDALLDYVVVADNTTAISNEEILALFQ